MRLAQAQLGGVLDRDDPLAAPMNADSALSVVVLPEPVPPLTARCSRAAHRAREEVAQRRRQRAVGDEVLGREAAAAEAADRERRAVERQRRHHHVHARAVGQPRVAQRLGLVDAAAERREDPLDRVAQLGLAGERARRSRSSRPSRSTHTGAGAVDHHLVDRGVGEQRLQRPEPERALGDPRGELVARALVEHAGLAVDERPDPLGPRRRRPPRLRQQPLAQRAGELSRAQSSRSIPVLGRGARGFRPPVRGGRRTSTASPPSPSRRAAAPAVQRGLLCGDGEPSPVPGAAAPRRARTARACARARPGDAGAVVLDA